MKKVLFALLACLTLIAVSCCTSPEKKAEKLIISCMKDMQVDPSLYEPIKTEIDTAYAPLDVFSIVEAAKYLLEDLDNIGDLEQNVQDAQFALRWANKNEYKARKLAYDASVKALNERLNKDIELFDDIIATVDSTTVRPIGFKARHSYRIKGQDGKVGQSKFYLNEDISKVIGWNDIDDERYQQAMNMLIAIQDGEPLVMQVKEMLQTAVEIYK